MKPVFCSYCDHPAKLVGGHIIYPHRPDLGHRHFWQCTPCNAYVGCHPGTMKPMGRLADAPLRALRQRVHAQFDPLHKSGMMTRTEAYAKLAAALRLSSANCHVGMFDTYTCEAALILLKAGL